MKMTDRVKRFCDEYLIDLNGAQAAIRAGYKGKQPANRASRLLKDEDVRAYIDARLAEKDKQLIASQDEVLKYLTSVMRGESQSEVVLVVNTGDFTSEIQRVKKKPDEKEKLKAGELLGKRYGIFTDKMNVTGAVPVVISGEEQLEN